MDISITISFIDLARKKESVYTFLLIIMLIKIAGCISVFISFVINFIGLARKRECLYFSDNNPVDKTAGCISVYIILAISFKGLACNYRGGGGEFLLI